MSVCTYAGTKKMRGVVSRREPIPRDRDGVAPARTEEKSKRLKRPPSERPTGRRRDLEARFMKGRKGAYLSPYSVSRRPDRSRKKGSRFKVGNEKLLKRVSQFMACARSQAGLKDPMSTPKRRLLQPSSLTEGTGRVALLPAEFRSREEKSGARTQRCHRTRTRIHQSRSRFRCPTPNRVVSKRP